MTVCFLFSLYIMHSNCLYFDLELKFLSFKIIISNENFNETIIHFISILLNIN